ncbi:MAG TPA: hypothetical protein VG675_06300 [Bryobacteraceae bacterium]|nr:hypothetical protein [Bryobacteraceae bacterium]
MAIARGISTALILAALTCAGGVQSWAQPHTPAASPAAQPAAAQAKAPGKMAPPDRKGGQAAKQAGKTAEPTDQTPQPGPETEQPPQSESAAPESNVPSTALPNFLEPPEVSGPTLPEPPPLLLAPPPPQIKPPELPTIVHSASEVIRAVLGLALLFGLAYMASRPLVQRIERKLGISQLVTSGFPFVILGLIAHLPAVGILSDSTLWEIRPLLALGLGWIGFVVGFRFDSRLSESLSPGSQTVAFVMAGVPFLTIVGACALVLKLMGGSLLNEAFLRDALILAAAGAGTARSVPRLLKGRGGDAESVQKVWSIAQLEQLAGIAGLMICAAFFRPHGATVAWQIPGSAWLFITLGMGATVGVVIYATLTKASGGAQFSVLLLGSVCFASGMASFLRLSPVVVCFIAGVVVVNLPGRSREAARETLSDLERPIYLLFLVIAGSLWQIGQWQGWILLCLLVGARLTGKWLGAGVCRLRHIGSITDEERRSLIFGPLGALAIAVVVNAQDLYFDPTISWMITAVIGGAIATEVIVQAALRPQENAAGYAVGREELAARRPTK